MHGHLKFSSAREFRIDPQIPFYDFAILHNLVGLFIFIFADIEQPLQARDTAIRPYCTFGMLNGKKLQRTDKSSLALAGETRKDNVR